MLYSNACLYAFVGYLFYPHLPSVLVDNSFQDVVLARFDALENRINELAVEHNLSEYDIWSESGRSEVEQTAFKDNLIKYYRRGGYWRKKTVKCMATNQWLPRNVVIAGHIWMSKMHGKGLQKFGLSLNDCTSPRNGFLMVKGVESNFDRKHLCLVYDAFAKCFRFRVLNPDLANEPIPDTNPVLKYGDLEKLHHPKDYYPFRRLLSWHAKCSFKFACSKTWITEAERDLFEPYHALSETASVPDI